MVLKKHLAGKNWASGISGMECWSGMVEWNNKKDPKTAIAIVARVNRVGKNSRYGDQLIKDRRLGDRESE